MDRKTKKRIEKLEGEFNAGPGRIVFIQLTNESPKEYDERIARWYAGEEVIGQDEPYTGNESVVKVSFIDTIGQGKRRAKD